MIRTKLLAGVLVAALATAGLAADKAERAKGGHGLKDTPIGKLIMGNLGRLMTLRSELNLTDAQKTKIRDILKGHKTQIATEAKKVLEKRAVLRDLVLAGTTDEQAVRKAADDLGKAIGDAAILGLKVRNEVAPVLTDDQKATIKKTRGEIDASVKKFLDKASKGE